MAAPIIQLGQCGNQIGANFFDIMFSEGLKSSPAHQSLLEQFFYPEKQGINKAKAILIDMQPKVVNKNLSLKKNWKFARQLSFVQQQGSGNNWAYGYNVHGPKVKDDIEKLITSFAQKQDYINCFTQIQSLAGGTGSGMGTFIVELLNQLFPKVPKFIVCIMPHLSGEVILQSYNACLSVGTIYKQADGIFIIQNDQISEICTKSLKMQKTSLQDINEVIGRNLASIFFPVVSKNTNKIFSTEQNQINYGIDIIQNLFLDNRYKFGSITSAPNDAKNSQNFNFDSWQAIENDLFHKNKWRSKGSLVIARGQDHPQHFNHCNPIIFDRHTFYNYNRSATLLENGPKLYPSFEKILTRAYSMFKQNAYIYQYQKYHIEKDNFLQCLGILENAQESYKKLFE